MTVLTTRAACLLRRLPMPLLVLGLSLAGCHKSSTKRVGGEIPTTAPGSTALPGADNAADAPHAPSVAESRDATLTTYRDPATGVSFRYPTVWRPATGQVLPVPAFTSVAGKARITQQFYPENTNYDPTVLRGLAFSYTVQAHSNPASCSSLPKKVTGSATNTTVASYNGVQYTEAQGADAGMCTQVQSTVDATLRGSQCFVFERDSVTSCPFVKTQTLPRPLTENENAALKRHLDAVMQSVTLVPLQ